MQRLYLHIRIQIDSTGLLNFECALFGDLQICRYVNNYVSFVFMLFGILLLENLL